MAHRSDTGYTGYTSQIAKQIANHTAGEAQKGSVAVGGEFVGEALADSL